MNAPAYAGVGVALAGVAVELDNRFFIAASVLFTLAAIQAFIASMAQ